MFSSAGGMGGLLLRGCFLCIHPGVKVAQGHVTCFDIVNTCFDIVIMQYNVMCFDIVQCYVFTCVVVMCHVALV